MQGHILTVVGNRPQFIKMAPISKQLAARSYREIVVHTGQHYDDKLNDIFFREMRLPTPDIQLITTQRTHGAMTGELLTKIEEVLLNVKPRHILLYGDTNSTLAAALAAVKLHIPIAHVEAGPRMHDLRLPEEANRITVDHLSQLLFCPDAPSVAHLKRENITEGVYNAGDVMLDAFNLYKNEPVALNSVLHHPEIKAGEFIFMTMHRPSNVDSEAALKKLYDVIKDIPYTILFPAHLRTLARMESYGIKSSFEALSNLVMVEPMGYLDTVAALNQCRFVITDSGGLQKEAYYAGKGSVVFLDETPWPDLRDSGWQEVVGIMELADKARVLRTVTGWQKPATAPAFYGTGHAAKTIVDALEVHGFLQGNFA